MVKLIRFLLTFGVATATAQPTPIRVIPLDAESYAALRQNNATTLRVVYPRVEEGYPFQDIDLHSKSLRASGFLADLSPVARVVDQQTLVDSFILNGRYIEYRDSSATGDTLIWGSGEYHNGRKHGTWTWQYRNKQTSAIEHYEDDKLISVQYFKPNGEPEPPGHIGDSAPRALNMAAVKANISFPEQLRRSNREGYVFARVLVDTNGAYVKHKLLAYSHQMFREAVEPQLPRLRFTPYILHNELTKVWVTIPFTFQFE